MYENKMEAEFNIIWKEETELNGSLNVSGQNNTLQGNIKVNRPPKNKMEAEFRTEIPKRSTEILTTIKDTYVTDLKPSLNYGESSIIKVGTDDNGYIYRGLMEFNIPNPLQTMYITKAELKLYSDDINKFDDLEISLPNKPWGEYNVVWYGQPSRKRIVKTVNLEEGKYEHTIDITDLIKNLWILYPYENQGLILKSKDETIKQIKNFGTRESINPPKLEIEYFDIDLFSATGSVIGGNIRVRRTGTSDTQGKISVFRHSGESELKGLIHVYNMDMLEGSINVAQFNNMNGRVISERLKKDIYGQVFPNKEKLYGVINVNALKNMSGVVKIKPNSNIDGLIDVKYKNDMLGQIIVNPLEKEDLKSLIKISDYNGLNGFVKVKYKNDMLGQFDVKYKSDLIGKIRSTYMDASNIEGLIKTILKTQMQGSIKVNPVGFKGLINVNSTNDMEGKININALQELQGKIITNIKNDLDGHIRVQAMDIDDLNGFIIVGENPNIKEGYIYAFIM